MRRHPFSIFGPSIESGVVQDNILDTLPFPVQMVNQVHGVEILSVTDLIETTKGYDAMVSNQVGIKLMIKTADCIPLVLADEEVGLIAAVHAGWRSLVMDIIPKTIDTLESMGADRKRIRVGMGPSLGTCCSKFSDPKHEIPEKYHWAILENQHVDLLSIAHQQLESAGISSDQVERMAICTSCDPSWFSWRRDKTKKRMGTYIELLKQQGESSG